MASWPVRAQQGSAESVRAILSAAQGVYAAEHEVWKRTVILTMSTEVHMLSNLHCSLKRLQLRHALAAVGQEALAFGLRHQLPTIDLGAISGLTLPAPPQQYLHFSQLGASGLMCAKIGLLELVVGDFGMDVLLLDTDMAFVHDPLPLLTRQAHQADVLIHTGINTLGCLPTPPHRLADCRRPEHEGSFHGSAAACVHGDGSWNAEQLQCACRAWASAPAVQVQQVRGGGTHHWRRSVPVRGDPDDETQSVPVRGDHPIPPPVMGFINSGLVWFRSHAPAQRLLRHLVAIMGNSSHSHNDQQALHSVLCSPRAVHPRLRAALIDTRVVSMAPTVFGMQLGEFEARLRSRSAPLAVSRRYCDALQQLRPREHWKPFVLHAAWNAPASAEAKLGFLKRTAMFSNASGGCNLTGPSPAIAWAWRHCLHERRVSELALERPATAHNRARASTTARMSWARGGCAAPLPARSAWRRATCGTRLVAGGETDKIALGSERRWRLEGNPHPPPVTSSRHAPHRALAPDGGPRCHSCPLDAPPDVISSAACVCVRTAASAPQSSSRVCRVKRPVACITVGSSACRPSSRAIHPRSARKRSLECLGNSSRPLPALSPSANSRSRRAHVAYARAASSPCSSAGAGASSLHRLHPSRRAASTHASRLWVSPPPDERTRSPRSNACPQPAHRMPR